MRIEVILFAMVLITFFWSLVGTPEPGREPQLASGFENVRVCRNNDFPWTGRCE
jgi:hypothetical protein